MKSRRKLPKIRIIILVMILLIVAVSIMVLSLLNIIRGDWTTALSIVLAAMAVLVPLLQWLFPWPSSPLSSNVSLIDAALDPQDSPYEQTTENGKQKIKYQGPKPQKMDKSNNTK